MRFHRTLVLALSGMSCGDAPQTDVSPTLAAVDAPPCTEIRPSGVLRSAPPPPGYPYLRCGTLAGEVQWHPLLSPDHRRLAVLTNAGTVRLVDTADWTEIAELVSPLGGFDAIAFSPDSKWLAAESQEAGQVTLFDALDASVVRNVRVRPVEQQEWAPFTASLAFSPDSRQIATSLQVVIDLPSGALHGWDGPAGVEHPARSGYEADRMDFLAGGHLLTHGTVISVGPTAIDDTERLSIVDPATRSRVNLYASSGGVHGLTGYAVAADRTLIAVSDASRAPGPLRVYEVGQTQPLAVDPLPGLTVLAFSHDSRELYTLTQNEIEVLDAKTLRSLRRFPWTFRAQFLGLSPAGLLVGANDFETSWWDPTTGQRVRTLSVQLKEVSWSADGELGTGTSAGALLHVWRERDGAELCRLAARTDRVSGLPDRASWKDFPARPDAPPSSVPLTATIVNLGHTRGTDWCTTEVRNRQTGELVRSFRPTARGCEALLSEDGSKLMTMHAHNNDGYSPRYVAVWCK